MGYSKDVGKYEHGIVQVVARAVEGESVRLVFANAKDAENARGRINGYIVAMRCCTSPGAEEAAGLVVNMNHTTHTITLQDREKGDFALMFNAAIDKGGIDNGTT